MDYTFKNADKIVTSASEAANKQLLEELKRAVERMKAVEIPELKIEPRYGFDLSASRIGMGTVTLDSKEETKPEEWIWVSGYKGTDSNMKCRDYQFELGKKFDMEEDAKIVICSSGFHLCKELKHVFKHYHIGNGNRFFEVSALVRKADSERYGNSFVNNKLVAKSILFTRELTVDEILANVNTEGWTEEEKKLAISHNIQEVSHRRDIAELQKLGYSEAFATYIVDEEHYKRYKLAKIIAEQKDLSMDMKVLAILKL